MPREVSTQCGNAQFRHRQTHGFTSLKEHSMSVSATGSGTFKVGGDITVHRLGFGAMRVTGKGIWGDPPDPAAARATLRRVPELGIDLIDTADSYGPDVSENLIRET